MRKIVILLLILITPLLGGASEKNSGKELEYPEFFPEWSWDKVAVCLHYAKRDGLTEQDAEFTAQFPLICLEKRQGVMESDGVTFRGSDIGTEIAAAQIKKYNPKTKILCYRSFRTDYGALYSTGSMLNTQEGNVSKIANPAWALKYKPTIPDQRTGTYVLVSNKYRVFDQSNVGARLWWIKDVTAWANKPNIDGIFIDAYGAVPSYDGVVNDYGEAKYEPWVNGVETKMKLIKQRISSNRIVLGNCISGTNTKSSIKESFRKLETLSGGMMEHFCILGSDSPSSIAASINTIHDVSKAGKMLVVKGWPRYTIKDSTQGVTPEQLEQYAREDIIFPLAVFLCGAGKYSYFCYSWNYDYEGGSHIMYDEYTKNLGEPLADYKKKGSIFTREFEHASVWVDVKAGKAKIDWR